jgi:hypothetical protein
MRFMTRSNQRCGAGQRDQRGADDEGAHRLGHAENPPARPGRGQHRRARRGPGDHDTGLRSPQRGDGRKHRPMPRPSAHIQEVICAGVA